MENRQGYDPSEFEDDYYTTPQPDAGKSIRGYRIVIIILSVILVAISVLYFSIHRQQMLDNELLQADRDSIQNDLGRLMTDYDGLRISNDSISAGLNFERERADSLMTRLKKERSWNLAKIKQYEKEVGTLRTIMKGYVNVSLPDDFDKILSVMRSRGVSVSIILQNLAQLKALFEKQWESIVGNCDEFLYLGGNEQSTHKYVSELLGKETIDTNTFGKSTGRSGNYSTNYQISGRELLTPDEVRMLDNQFAILFIRGERPIMDFKYDIMKHPNVALTTDGKASPYKHGEVTKDIASIAIWDIDPATLPEKEMEETNWELLSDEEMEALFINNQTN